MVTASTTEQELHSRVNGGVHVRLMWRAHDDYLFVYVIDRRQGQEFRVEVRDRARALDVFNHPFAYAALDLARELTAASLTSSCSNASMIASGSETSPASARRPTITRPA